MHISVKTAALFAIALSALGQPKFSSVKIAPNNTPYGANQIVGDDPKITASQVSMPWVTMRHLLWMAFGREFGKEYAFSQIRGITPTDLNWVNGTHYSLEATIPAGANVEQVPEMIQEMLKDKFGLVYHIENEPTLTLSLAIDSRWPLKFPKAQASVPFQEVLSPASFKLPDGTLATAPFRTTRLTITDTMAAFAKLLSTRTRQLVTDDTGLLGMYAFDISIRVAAGPDPFGNLDVTHIEVGRNVRWYKFALDTTGLKLDEVYPNMPKVVIDHLDQTPKN